ncbi:MAG: hypothetical protein R6X16_05550 [Anaerolineae bacterium]
MNGPVLTMVGTVAGFQVYSRGYVYLTSRGHLANGKLWISTIGLHTDTLELYHCARNDLQMGDEVLVWMDDTPDVPGMRLLGFQKLGTH